MDKNLNTLVRAIRDAADAFLRAEQMVVKMPVTTRIYTNADLALIEENLVKFENGKANARQTLKKMGGDMDSHHSYESLKRVLRNNGHKLVSRRQGRV